MSGGNTNEITLSMEQWNATKSLLRTSWSQAEAMRRAFHEFVESIDDPKIRIRARNEFPGLFRDDFLEKDVPKILGLLEEEEGTQARIHLELLLPFGPDTVQ